MVHLDTLRAGEKWGRRGDSHPLRSLPGPSGIAECHPAFPRQGGSVPRCGLPLPGSRALALAYRTPPRDTCARGCPTSERKGRHMGGRGGGEVEKEEGKRGWGRLSTLKHGHLQPKNVATGAVAGTQPQANRQAIQRRRLPQPTRGKASAPRRWWSSRAEGHPRCYQP